MRVEYFSRVYLVVVELANAAFGDQVWDVDVDGWHLVELVLLEILDLGGSK